MADMTLDELRSQLYGLDEYRPEDETTLRQRAIDIYSPQYQQDLAALRDQIEFEVGRQQRNAVNRGMQRSSYNEASQAAIRSAGLKSQANLSANYESNIANLLYDMLGKEKDRQNAAGQYRNELLLKLYGMQPTGGSGGYVESPLSEGVTKNKDSFGLNKVKSLGSDLTNRAKNLLGTLRNGLFNTGLTTQTGTQTKSKAGGGDRNIYFTRLE